MTSHSKHLQKQKIDENDTDKKTDRVPLEKFFEFGIVSKERLKK